MSLFPFNPNAGQKIQGSENGSNANIPALGMGFIVHWSKTPNALSANAVLAATALTASPQAGITAGVASPDVARNISIVANDTDVVGNVVIHGTNLAGETISETLALNGTTTVNGSKAFATVTSVDLPAQSVDSSETVAVGYGNKLGLHHTLPVNTVPKGMAFVNGAREGTEPTIATDKTHVESNTALFNTAVPGSQVMDLYYIVGT